MASSDPTPIEGDGHCWEQGWDGHEHAQRQRMAALPFVERLKWLEEAQDLVLAMRAAREMRQQAASPPVPKDP